MQKYWMVVEPGDQWPSLVLTVVSGAVILLHNLFTQHIHKHTLSYTYTHMCKLTHTCKFTHTLPGLFANPQAPISRHCPLLEDDEQTGERTLKKETVNTLNELIGILQVWTILHYMTHFSIDEVYIIHLTNLTPPPPPRTHTL